MKDLSPSSRIRPLPQYLPVDSTDPQRSIGAEKDVDLREYFKVVYSYRLIVLGVVVFITTLSLVYSLLITPKYSAVAKVRINSYEPVLTTARIEDVMQKKSQEAGYLETQIQEITSLSLADIVLSDESLRTAIFNDKKKRGEGWFSSLLGRKEKSPGAARASNAVIGASYNHSVQDLTEYLKLLRIEPVRRTSLVNIIAITEDKELSARIANAHANAYINWVRSSRIKTQSAGLKFLSGHTEELKVKVADIERELAEYAEKNSIVAVNKDENITAQRMSQLNELLTKVTGERMEVENLYKEAQQDLGSLSAGFDDESTQNMRSRLAQLEAEYGNLGAKFLPTYPKMRQLGAEIKNLKDSIQGQRKQIVSGLKSKYQAALQKEKGVREELEQQKSLAFELSKSQVQYNILNRELESNRDLLEKSLLQIKETAMTVESNASNISIVDYAIIPEKPSYPKKRIILSMGVFFGLFIGIGLAFILSYLDNTIRTPDQVSSVLRLPTLGIVPSFEKDKGPSASVPGAAPMIEANKTNNEIVSESNGDDGGGDLLPTTNGEFSGVPLVYVNYPKSHSAESYRTIRTAILLSQAGEPPRTILVSSAQSSEGKTTSAANLAATLASSGGQVVIIDADLRRPSVYKSFGLPKSLDGLVEVITGQKVLSDVMIKDKIRRVTIIPSGKIPPNPAELLASIEMAQILESLRQEFDYVIIDSPPILPVTDSVILSRYVDGVVMVVKGAATPRKVVKDAKDRLVAAGARILGVILNDVDITGGDYYYYNRYYYAYYAEEEISGNNRGDGSSRAA